MSSVVIEAEFVEVGKHQKVVTDIWSMHEDEALVEFAAWKRCSSPKQSVYWKGRAKQIRNNLRSFGWYIVKSNGGYQLMEEIDIIEARKNGDACTIAFLLLKEGDDDRCDRMILRSRKFHIVWVPSLKKRLIMRSVA